MAIDRNLGDERSLSGPVENAFPISANDVTEFDSVTRALYIGQAGHVAVVMKGGQTVTFSNVPAGSLLPIRVTRVLATGTTAGLIIGLF